MEQNLSSTDKTTNRLIDTSVRSRLEQAEERFQRSNGLISNTLGQQSRVGAENTALSAN